MGRRQPNAETDTGVYGMHDGDILPEDVELHGIFDPVLVYTLQRSAVQAIEDCIIYHGRSSILGSPITYPNRQRALTSSDEALDHHWRAVGMDLAVAFKLACTLEVHPGDLSVGFLDP